MARTLYDPCSLWPVFVMTSNDLKLHTVFPRNDAQGDHLKFSLPGEVVIRRGCLFHLVDIQTQSFPTVVSRKRESVKKPYENGKVSKQYEGNVYKTMSIYQLAF